MNNEERSAVWRMSLMTRCLQSFSTSDEGLAVFDWRGGLENKDVLVASCYSNLPISLIMIVLYRGLKIKRQLCNKLTSNHSVCLSKDSS